MATFTLGPKQLEQLPSLQNTLQACKTEAAFFKKNARQAVRVSKDHFESFSAWLFKSFCDSSGLSLPYDGEAQEGAGIAYRVDTSIPTPPNQGKISMRIEICDAYKNVFWIEGLNELHIDVYAPKNGQVTVGAVTVHYASGGHQDSSQSLAICQMKAVGFLFAEFVIQQIKSNNPELMDELGKVVAAYDAMDEATDGYINKLVQLKNEIQAVLANNFDAAAAEQVKEDLFSRRIKAATLLVPNIELSDQRVSIMLTPINLSVNERGRKVVRYEKKNEGGGSAISDEEMTQLNHAIRFAFIPDRLNLLLNNPGFESQDSIVIEL